MTHLYRETLGYRNICQAKSQADADKTCSVEISVRRSMQMVWLESRKGQHVCVEIFLLSRKGVQELCKTTCFREAVSSRLTFHEML